MMKKSILFVSIIFIASCSLPPAKETPVIKEQLKVGSLLYLRQQLIIPKQRTFIYIANGKVASLKNYNTVDIYQPYCMFFLKKETSEQMIISPDTFEVTKVIEWEDYYSQFKSGFMKAEFNAAWSGGIIKVGGDRGDVMYATIISLRSEKQGDVDKLVCGYWDDYYRIKPLTLEQLKFTLGDLIRVDVKNNKKYFI